MEENIREIVEEIIKKSDLDKKEIEERIKEKQKEFSGLVSKEGVIHIVAKEMGVNLLEKKEKSLKIKNIVSGMSSVKVTGRVMKILESRKFEKNGREGKVCNIFIGDETGAMRMSLWNGQVSLVENNEIEEGDKIQISNGYVKKNNRGDPELRVGKSGMIKRSDKNLPSLSELEKSHPLSKSFKNRSGEVKIDELKKGGKGRVRGVLVKIFDINPFFTTCPKCGKGIDEECEEHGKVEPQKALVLSGVIDDGRSNIRTVFFRENVEKVLGKNIQEIKELTDNGENLEKFRERANKVLGKELEISGRTKINEYFEREELIANNVNEVEPENKARKIINNLSKGEKLKYK